MSSALSISERVVIVGGGGWDQGKVALKVVQLVSLLLTGEDGLGGDFAMSILKVMYLWSEKKHSRDTTQSLTFTEKLDHSDAQHFLSVRRKISSSTRLAFTNNKIK